MILGSRSSVATMVLLVPVALGIFGWAFANHGTERHTVTNETKSTGEVQSKIVGPVGGTSNPSPTLLAPIGGTPKPPPSTTSTDATVTRQVITPTPHQTISPRTDVAGIASPTEIAPTPIPSGMDNGKLPTRQELSELFASIAPPGEARDEKTAACNSRYGRLKNFQGYSVCADLSDYASF